LIGVIGVAVSLYSIFSKDPSIWILTITGWGAAILVAVSLCMIIFRLAERLSTAYGENQRLRDEITETRARLSQMQLIDAYLTSRIDLQEVTPRRAKSRRRVESTPDAPPPGAQIGELEHDGGTE
jgi:hypothetical protein